MPPALLQTALPAFSDCDVPVLFVFTQSSSDYISPYELPFVVQSPTDEVKESESPAAGNEA